MEVQERFMHLSNNWHYVHKTNFQCALPLSFHEARFVYSFLSRTVAFPRQKSLVSRMLLLRRNFQRLRIVGNPRNPSCALELHAVACRSVANAGLRACSSFHEHVSLESVFTACVVSGQASFDLFVTGSIVFSFDNSRYF